MTSEGYSSVTSKRSPSVDKIPFESIKEESSKQSTGFSTTNISRCTTIKKPFEQPKRPTTRIMRGECESSKSSSHTQIFRESKYVRNQYERITKEQYLGISPSISETVTTHEKIPLRQPKKYTPELLLKRNLIKELDPLPLKPEWSACPSDQGWELARTLKFLIYDPVGSQHWARIDLHLSDLCLAASKGFRIDFLDEICEIMDFLVENLDKIPKARDHLAAFLKLVEKPVYLTTSTDIQKYFHKLRKFLGYIGYLLLRVPDDDLFMLVAHGLIFQLTAPNSLRDSAARRKHTNIAAKKVLVDTIVRMIAISTPSRFSTYVDIAFILAINSQENCMDFMMQNVIENVFYRFNPYVFDKALPEYEINPVDISHHSIRLGDSSIHISAVLSLLLVLLKATVQHLQEYPHHRDILPCPDSNAQRCFVWAYRYECRAVKHYHQRNTLTVIVDVMLNIFGDRLNVFGNNLMADVFTLAVRTELPPRKDWTGTVSMSKSEVDVKFKRFLILLSTTFLRTFCYSRYIAQDRQWVTGLMYLIDPGLCPLRTKWSSALFAELRKISLQALLLSLNSISPTEPVKYSMVRRTMWYIEWYCESPFDLTVLYWCVRLIQSIIISRSESYSKQAVKELVATHGVVVFMNLCDVLMRQKFPPMLKSQSIIALILQVLTKSLDCKGTVRCIAYPHLKWPQSLCGLINAMLNTLLVALDKQSKMIADRWLISLLEFIWEAIIWKDENRVEFVANNGIYNLLDIITMTKYPVQGIALALICDTVRAGDAVGQLVTWRANFGANNADPKTVGRGATIASLLAAIFEKECRFLKLKIDEDNVLQDIDYPLMSSETVSILKSSEFKKEVSKDVCLAASDLAGSCMPKCYAILEMLSEDLKYKVGIADEAYNLYRNVKISPRHEAILYLCSHFLTLKLNQAWMETEIQSPGFVPEDNSTLAEFLHIGSNWSKLIRQQQLDIIEKNKKQEFEKESTLYEFLGRMRLNIALDALKEVRCVARSADRTRMAHSLLQEAVHAYHRRSVSQKLPHGVISTYRAPLDMQNIIGQNLKVLSIPKRIPKNPPNPRSSRMKLNVVHPF